jgi:hypothetical protein
MSTLQGTSCHLWAAAPVERTEGVKRFLAQVAREVEALSAQIRAMAERGEGVILNIASMNAFRPLTKIPRTRPPRQA